jgi:hypothetical protein
VRLHDGHLEEVHIMQHAPVRRRPGVALGDEAEAHAAQVAALGQDQQVAAECSVGNVQLEGQAPAILSQAQRA